ncbi:hypothetical protein G6F46_000646 [Rhizopus delemar]|nr:hypothetical protein G6F49_000654 [Rhizopus delemar]KAG1595335.1 hypothetical protein G6F48_000751 [Rhizopus delemar]KAG1604656.1 hypothetical protein G6F47_000715 [Rhizopus delemar]KAG1622671.1 hypothetical protein G6F46_000646 [Rhizopus delemar]
MKVIPEELRQQETKKRLHSEISEEIDNDHEEQLTAWATFLVSAKDDETIHAFSPARHNVIRCGRNISCRPMFPKDIYNFLDSRACEYIDRVLGSETLSDFKRNCKNIPAMLTENPLLSNQVDFLEEIFIAGTKIYASHLQFTHSEAVLKDLFVDPFLKAAFSLTGAEKYPDFNVGFYPDEEALLSTTKKLKLKGEHVDNCFSYHADGILRVHNYGDIEICVVEVSGAFKKMT